MHIAGDRRGVSEVIGALVIFAFLVIGFAGYQAVSVPDQNAEVEFQHNQEVAAEMMGVRDVILDAGYAETGSQRLSLGLRYPTRTFAVNPGTVVGTLDSTALGAYEFTGRGGGSAPTGVPSATEACGYESGTPSSTRITYQAGYSQYQPSPTIAYENSLTARAFPAPRDTTRVDTSQLIVRGDTIRLFPTNGSVSAAQVGPYPITATGGIANVVEVPANTEFTLRLPTRFSLSVWQDETDLADQPIVDSLESGGDGYINVNIDTGADSTTIWCRPVGLNGEPPAQELTPPTEQDTETGATDDASFETLVVDQSDTGSGVARYEVSYDVPADSPVETVEVLYNNRDSSYSTRTYTRSVGPDGGRENIEDYGWSYDPQTSGDEYRIVVVGLDESGDVVDSKVVADTADGGDPTWRDTLVESDSPTYDSASFTDTTPEFSAASYEFEYQVSDPSNFEEVELLIRNLDNGNVYQTSSSAPDGTISWQNPSYGNGDQYELVAQLQDADGVVVAQETFTDRADGSDGGTPSGSAALEYAGGLQSTEAGQLQFELTNPGSGQVTVTSVTVTDSFSQRITRSGGPEVQLANGEATGGGNGFTTDGGRATFSPQATIAGGATETLEFQFFANSGGNRRVSQTTLAGLSQVSSESQADLTIVLETNQGDVTLYFEE